LPDWDKDLSFRDRRTLNDSWFVWPVSDARGFSARVLAQSAGPAITEQEAQAIGVDAYLYLYPLVSMDVTRRQFTNVEPGKVFGKAPMNMFASAPEYPPADFRASCGGFRLSAGGYCLTC